MSNNTNEDRTAPPAVPFVDPTAPAPIVLGVRGRYRVVGELGAGGFGTVHLAEEEATGQRVAIRFLPGGLADALHALVQGRSRSIVDASTSHPGLVRVLEFGEAEKRRLFVAMEFVEGRRLSEILSGGEPLDIGAALRLSLDLGGAVEALHNLGLIHGALRPRNVMVLDDGRVKLMDVELADLRDTPAMEGVITAKPPPEYGSPERIRQAPVTEKTDVYAFAVILYEVLCGVPPFRAATTEDVLAMHLTEKPVPLRLRRPTVPVAVDRIVKQALDKQPELRPFMSDVLNVFWEEANARATRWKWTAAIVSGAALAASIAGLVAWGLFAPRPSGLRTVAQSLLLSTEQALVSASPTASGPTAANPEAPVAGSVTPANPAADTGAYWVQVGAFKDPKAAKRLAVRLRQQNYRVEESSARAAERRLSGSRASAAAASMSGDVLHRVRVGPYADRAAASSALETLEGQGYAPFIARK